MPKEIKVEYHKLTTTAGGTSDRPVFRAMIRFAPGPHGALFTDTYMGQKAVETVVDKLCENLNCTAVVISAR